jgi:hypothetical protein
VRGAVAAKANVVEPTCFQVPATAGFNVGMGLEAESGAERWTVMAMSEGTFTAPDVGVVETIDKALAGAPDVVDVEPVAPAAGFEGECRKARVVPTAAMAMSTTTKETIQTGRCPLGAPKRLECAFMDCATQPWVGARYGSWTLIGFIDTDRFHPH